MLVGILIQQDVDEWKRYYLYEGTFVKGNGGPVRMTLSKDLDIGRI